MAVMLVCGALVLVGITAVVRWGGVSFQAPGHSQEGEAPLSADAVSSRYLWSVTVAVVAGIGSGVLIAGAGGRLAMRLLAVTAGDAAQGRLTEADEIVGRITTGGSIGFIVFTALFFGAATGALYLLVRRWLPPGRLGGLAYGLLLLILAAPSIEPLRADNPDFGIVGPGWLAVLVFSAVVLVHGMAVAALAGRYSRALPLPSTRRRALVAYLPLLMLVPAAPVALIVAFAGLVVVVLSRVEPLVRAARSPRTMLGGGVVIAVVMLVALPGFLSAIVDIAGES